MTPARLDRLSALLEGIRPRVSLAEHDSLDTFCLHLVQGPTPPKAKLCMQSAPMDAMRLLVCPPGHGLQEYLLPGERGWIAFEVGFDGPVGPVFMAEFGGVISIPMQFADPSLAQIVQLIASEMQTDRCGQPLLMDRAGDILLIGLMRHLIARPQKTTGLFTALSDPRIAKSLVALHTHCANDWTLESLAQVAGMSRTAFASQFTKIMHIAPGKYLGNLRLAIARQMAASGLGLKQIAQKTGYASASTLSRAMGRTGAGC